MAAQLRIVWDGDAPGIAEHRLSLAAFGEALLALLAALRRIASSVVTENSAPEYGSKGGKYAGQAELLDLELESVGRGSVDTLATVVTRVRPGTTAPLFLEREACRQFLDLVEAEGRGEARSAPVRKFLGTIPAGVSSQRYTLEDAGRVLKSVSIGPMSLAEEPPPLPGLISIRGKVIAVGFEPGRPEIKFETSEGIVTCSALAEHVERAIELRGTTVCAEAVAGRPHRLLWIRSAEEGAPTLDDDARARWLLARWSDALARLAR
jgi:hypothetical protein